MLTDEQKALLDYLNKSCKTLADYHNAVAEGYAELSKYIDNLNTQTATMSSNEIDNLNRALIIPIINVLNQAETHAPNSPDDIYRVINLAYETHLSDK